MKPYISTKHIQHLVADRFNGWIQAHPPFTSNIIPAGSICYHFMMHASGMMLDVSRWVALSPRLKSWVTR